MQSILGNTRKADITFYASGRIDISARVAKHLQLSRGDVLDIMIDQDEFYLYVRLRSPNGRHEAITPRCSSGCWASQCFSLGERKSWFSAKRWRRKQQLKQDYV